MILYHRQSAPASPACNGPAVELLHDHVSRFHDDPKADSVKKFDGTHPQRGEPMLCGSCANPVYPWMLDR